MPIRRAKEIRFDTHALRRMQQRAVSRDQIEACVTKPDLMRPARSVGARRFEKQLSRKKRLAVVIEEHDAYIRVITAWWISR